MKLFDNHTHSCFSTDSQMDMEQAVETAISRGLKGMAFTDHLDFNPPPGSKQFFFDVPPQQEAIVSVCRKLGVANSSDLKSDRDFTLLQGVEIGIQQVSMEEIRHVMSSYRFDCVIGSLHLIDDMDPYSAKEYYETKDYREAYGHYLEEFYRGMVTFGDFDIMGHFDYIVRYAPYEECIMRYSEFRDVFDEILRYLVENGKTFEINTKTYHLYRNRLPELDLDILRRYRELGGEAISFGSDAHDVGRIGENFEWCRECALAAGIRYEAYYMQRKPQYVTL